MAEGIVSWDIGVRGPESSADQILHEKKAQEPESNFEAYDHQTMLAVAALSLKSIPSGHLLPSLFQEINDG